MPEIAHVDLWNENVAFLERERPWPMPAVFIEFAPIRWRALADGVEYRAEAEVRLHIVSPWECLPEYHAQMAELFVLPTLIHERLAGLGGDTFQALDLVESLTNHNHEEIVEQIEVYTCAAYKTLIM